MTSLANFGHIRCKSPWKLEDDNGNVNIEEDITTGDVIIRFDLLQFTQLSDSNSTLFVVLDISSTIRTLSAACNARFIELYTVHGETPVYLKTFKGVSNPLPGSNQDIFAHLLNINMKGPVTLKMVSIKPGNTSACFWVGLELYLSPSANTPAQTIDRSKAQMSLEPSIANQEATALSGLAVGYLRPIAPSRPPPATTATPPPSTVPSLPPAGMLGLERLLHQVQESLLDKMSALLDKKIAPVLQRLDAIETKLECFSKSNQQV
jgi:hypothetical protein